jgi:hypothetical protein
MLLFAQPVVRDLSKVCKNFLALEEENRRLSAQLEDVRREYCFAHLIFRSNDFASLFFNMTPFKRPGIVAQAAADKMSLKAQLDNLMAEKSELKAKADGLVEEVARLKSESTKAEELAKTRRLEAESREKDLHQRLQTSLDVLRSESSISFLNFSALTKFPIDWRSCSFLKPLPNWTPGP